MSRDRSISSNREGSPATSGIHRGGEDEIHLGTQDVKREIGGDRRDKNLLVERCSDGGLVDGGWEKREVSKCSANVCASYTTLPPKKILSLES